MPDYDDYDDMKMQQTSEGKILKTTTGKIAGECCCEEEEEDVAACLTDCTACPTTFTITLSSNQPTAACTNPTLNCASMDGTFILTKVSPASTCRWERSGAIFIDIKCETIGACAGEPSIFWILNVFNTSGCRQTWVAPATNNCPPTPASAWTQRTNPVGPCSSGNCNSTAFTIT